MSFPTDSIRWSDLELTMRDFVDDFRNLLPVLLIARTGYSGCDEEIDQIGASEVYWVYEIQRQKRIVARQENENNFISIPVDYPLNVQAVANGKLGPAMSVKELSELLVQCSNSIEIQFENNQSVSFQVGADIGKETRFGNLTVEDSYEEKYLLAYTVNGGEIFAKTVGLPVYMDITVSVAEGLTYGDPTTFNQWIEELKKITGRFTSTPSKMCQEIILFNQIPSRGEYEYLKPTQIANRQPTCTGIDGKPAHGVKSTPGGKPNRENKLNVYVESPERPVIQKMVKSSLPPFPRRPPPPLPGETTPPGYPVSSPTKGFPEMPKKPGKTIPLFGNKHALPVLHRSWKPISPPSSNAKEQKYININSSSSAVSLPVPDTPSSLGHTQQFHSGSLIYEHLQVESFDSYKSLDEVPADIDVRGLSVEEVSKVLSLMRLGSHCNAFESRYVDGALLLELNEDILARDFGFSTFDARQLIMFTKGWRPKKK